MKKFFTYIYIVVALFAFVCVYKGEVRAQSQSNENFSVNTAQYTMMVFPTPADTRAYVRLSPALKSKVDKVEIINLIGRKIKEQKIITKSTTEISFNDIGELPQGIYMVVARDEYGQILQSAKLVISR